MKNLQKFSLLTPKKFLREVPPSATSTFFGRYRQSIFADICRWQSLFFLNVDLDVDFSRCFQKNVDIGCRYLSKYADMCRKMSISVPILVDMCRYMSKNVDFCVDLGRSMSKNVDFCVDFGRYRSIYGDICRYILNSGFNLIPKMVSSILVYHYQVKQNEIIIFHTLGVSLYRCRTQHTIPYQRWFPPISTYQLDGQFCSIFGHFYPF